MKKSLKITAIILTLSMMMAILTPTAFAAGIDFEQVKETISSTLWKGAINLVSSVSKNVSKVEAILNPPKELE